MHTFQTLSAKFLIGLILLVGPLTVAAQSAEAAHRALLLQLIEVLQQQILLLQAELAERTAPPVAAEWAEPGLAGEFSATVDMVASYPVAGISEVRQLTDSAHRRYFTRVYELFPPAYEAKLGRLAIFTGRSVSFDAFVETIPPRHEQWLFAVHEDMLAEVATAGNTELIVHELAHIVAYEQITGSAASDQWSCHPYFTKHGCPPERSYLSRFVSTFWTDADLAQVSKRQAQTGGVGAFYAAHETDFVTEYAATSPEEDFAESFMHYVLDMKPPRGVARDKVDFFAEYPEMQALRAAIRQGL